MPPSSPYRTPATRTTPPTRKTPLLLVTVYRVAPWLLFCWALARVLICTTRPLDFQMVFAVVVVVTFVTSRWRR
jgi:hypothetical protein